MGMTNTVRRIAGLGAAILLIATLRLGFHVVQQARAGIPVTAVLGVAGSGLAQGSDVKMRGVPVGRVTQVDFREGRAVAEFEIQPDKSVPANVRVVVVAKTLLGPKEIDLRPGGPLEPPYLEAGDTIRVNADDHPTEVQDVLAEITRVFDDIPPGDLATLVDALGSFGEEDARVVAQNIDQGAELSAFGARTADDQIARLSALADIAEALAPRADDFNRLNRSLPEWTSILPDRQAAVRDALDELGEFSTGLAEFLEVEQRTIDRLLAAGDRIGATIEPRVHEIGTFLHGIYRYTRVFGEHGGSLDDGTEHAWFRAHIGDEGEFGRFCAQLPPEIARTIPGCVERRQGG